MEALRDVGALRQRLDGVEAAPPDWVILELSAEDPDGGLVSRIRERYPNSEVVVLGAPTGAAGLFARREPFDLLEAVGVFANQRSLSNQQTAVLRLHIEGLHDKEIAVTLGKAPATIYEHWRRMAHKLFGRTKSDVVAEFHRFLAQRGSFTLHS